MNKLIEKFLNLSVSDKINIYRSGIGNPDTGCKLLNILDNENKWTYFIPAKNPLKVKKSDNFEGLGEDYINLMDVSDLGPVNAENKYFQFVSPTFMLDNIDNIIPHMIEASEGGLYISPNYDFAVGFYIYKEEQEENSFYFYCTVDGVQALKDFIKNNLKECEIVNDLEIFLLKQDSSGNYRLDSHPIKPILNLDIKDNYNDDFLDVHASLYKNILTKDKSFNILHGLPGTGKTTYIKYLSYVLSKANKEVVYLPPSITDILSTPHFLNCLSMFKDKVVIIEDAESILMKSHDRSQAVNNILNITDGILSDIYNIHFIFTFNMDIRQIDEALLRKGRLTLKYEFKELTDDKIAKLSEKLGVKIPNKKVLAEIYNTESTGVESNTSKIGF